MFARRSVLAALLAAIALWPGGPALALDQVRLGKAVPNSFAFGAAEVGIEAKIFDAEGIKVEVTSFRGDAQLQQALAAGGVDVGLGSGPGLGFRAKGAPAIGVAAMYGPPANLALVLPLDTPIRTIADLKGKRIGVTHRGLAHRLAGTGIVATAGLGQRRDADPRARPDAGAARCHSTR